MSPDTNVSPGSSITITGTNFGSTQGSSSVTVGGIAVGTATPWSSTSIVCVVPTSVAAGAQDVIVTVNSQASNSSSITIVAYAPLITGYIAGGTISWGTNTNTIDKYVEPSTCSAITARISSSAAIAAGATVLNQPYFVFRWAQRIEKFVNESSNCTILTSISDYSSRVAASKLNNTMYINGENFPYQDMWKLTCPAETLSQHNVRVNNLHGGCSMAENGTAMYIIGGEQSPYVDKVTNDGATITTISSQLDYNNGNARVNSAGAYYNGVVYICGGIGAVDVGTLTCATDTVARASSAIMAGMSPTGGCTYMTGLSMTGRAAFTGGYDQDASTYYNNMWGMTSSAAIAALGCTLSTSRVSAAGAGKTS